MMGCEACYFVWTPAAKPSEAHHSSKYLSTRSFPARLNSTVFIPRRCLSISASKSRPAGFGKKTKKKIEDDPWESLFEQLEKDLANDMEDSGENEITEEDVANFERELDMVVEELANASNTGIDSELGDVPRAHSKDTIKHDDESDGNDNKGVGNNDEHRDEYEDADYDDNYFSDDDFEEPRKVSLQRWQLRKLVAAVELGRRKVHVSFLLICSIDFMFSSICTTALATSSIFVIGGFAECGHSSLLPLASTCPSRSTCLITADCWPIGGSGHCLDILVKSLAAELQLDRDDVLFFLKNPPPELLLAASEMKEKSGEDNEPVLHEKESFLDNNVTDDSLVSKDPDADQAVSSTSDDPESHEMKKRTYGPRDWIKGKRIKKVHLATLQRVYKRSKWPSNALVESVVHATNLPRRRILEWFEEERVKSGIRVVPRQSSASRKPWKRPVTHSFERLE